MSIVSGPAKRSEASMPVKASGDSEVRSSIATPDFVFPVEIVGRERHEPEFFCFFRVEALLVAEYFIEFLRLGQKPRLQTRQTIAHRKCAGVQLGNSE